MGEARRCAAETPGAELEAFAEKLVSDLSAAIRKELAASAAATADRLETAMRCAIARTPVPAERSATPKRVFVTWESPQWMAWAKYRPLGLPEIVGTGWWFDSEWPPNHPKTLEMEASPQ